MQKKSKPSTEAIVIVISVEGASVGIDLGTTYSYCFVCSTSKLCFWWEFFFSVIYPLVYFRKRAV
jgi:hypothetical protein